MNALTFRPHNAKTAQLCSLAGRYAAKRNDASGWIAQPKIDGWRALWFRGLDSQPRLWTRNGHAIEGTGHIAHEITMIEQAAGERLFIDGEFQVNGTLADTKRWCETDWKAGGEAGQLFIFDALTESEWRSGGGDMPLHERLDRLDRWLAAVPPMAERWEWRAGSHGADGAALPPIERIADYWLCDNDDVADQARAIWRKGGEGLMLKDPAAPYRRNRTNEWLKVKEEKQL